MTYEFNIFISIIFLGCEFLFFLFFFRKFKSNITPLVYSFKINSNNTTINLFSFLLLSIYILLIVFLKNPTAYCMPFEPTLPPDLIEQIRRNNEVAVREFEESLEQNVDFDSNIPYPHFNMERLIYELHLYERTPDFIRDPAEWRDTQKGCYLLFSFMFSHGQNLLFLTDQNNAYSTMLEMFNNLDVSMVNNFQEAFINIVSTNRQAGIQNVMSSLNINTVHINNYFIHILVSKNNLRILINYLNHELTALEEDPNHRVAVWLCWGDLCNVLTQQVNILHAQRIQMIGDTVHSSAAQSCLDTLLNYINQANNYITIKRGILESQPNFDRPIITESSSSSSGDFDRNSYLTLFIRTDTDTYQSSSSSDED